MNGVMRFLQWVAWVFSHDYMAINLFVGGFLIFIGLSAWQERDFSYAIIPFAMAASATVFFIYKQTAQPINTPCLGVQKILCMDTEKKGRLNIISGEVVLKETEPRTVFRVTLNTYLNVGGYSEFASIIESVRTIKVRSGGFDMSWNEISIPGECRTPYGVIMFKEIKPV